MLWFTTGERTDIRRGNLLVSRAIHDHVFGDRLFAVQIVDRGRRNCRDFHVCFAFGRT